MRLTAHYLQWYLRQRLNRLGFFGVVGLGLLAFCVMFYFSALVPLRAEARAFQLEAERKQAGQHGANTQSNLPAAQLDTFYRNFPNTARLSDILETLNRDANKQGVVLERGEYRLLSAGADKLIRYEMTLPIKSDYLHLRAFLANLLVDLPNVSLDSIVFQRQKVSDPALEAQVKLTVFLLER